jgi:hypothetical protein
MSFSTWAEQPGNLHSRPNPDGCFLLSGEVNTGTSGGTRGGDP